MIERPDEKIGKFEERLSHAVEDFLADPEKRQRDFSSADMESALDLFEKEDCEGDVDRFLETVTDLVDFYMRYLNEIVEDLYNRREDVTDRASFLQAANEIPQQYWDNVSKIPFSSLSKIELEPGEAENFFTVFKITLSHVLSMIYAVNKLLQNCDLTSGQRKKIEEFEEALEFFAHDALGESSLLCLQNEHLWYQDEDSTEEDGIEMYHASLRRLFACCLMFRQRIKKENSFPVKEFDVLKILDDIFVLVRERSFRINRDRNRPIFEFRMETNSNEVLISGSPEAFFLILYNITKNIYKLVVEKYGENLRKKPGEVPPEVKLPDFPIQVIWNISKKDDVIFLEYLDEGVGLAFTEILEELRGMAVEAIRNGTTAEVIDVVQKMARGSYYAREITIGGVTDVIFEKAVSAIPVMGGSGSKSGLGLFEAKELLKLNRARILATSRLESRGAKILIAIPVGEDVDLQDEINRHMERMDEEEVERIRYAA